jgi:hypothetical protein
MESDAELVEALARAVYEHWRIQCVMDRGQTAVDGDIDSRMPTQAMDWGALSSWKHAECRTAAEYHLAAIKHNPSLRAMLLRALGGHQVARVTCSTLDPDDWEWHIPRNQPTEKEAKE